jgi:diaminohydroxyphosphoribosylaminopyrimidine deaminase / 5-amino-6-(5-phosphoribosylamino)uracil reductase
MNSQDKHFMQEALLLAKKGINWTFPNPMVGAVLVKNGKVIGQGYHKKAGFAHAEIEAFKNSSEDPKGATLYVTLEPCSFFGRTPPCVDEIIKKGVAKVVCSVKDPNPKVNGKGIQKLKDAGIAVDEGLLSEQAMKVNEGFFTFHRKKRPFVAIKFATSLDGKIATRTGDSKWITNEKGREYARSLRADYQAILVGINTVLHDNPNLGARQKDKKDPIRIILDSTLKIPLESHVLRDVNALLVTTKRLDKEKFTKLQEKGITVVVLPKDSIEISEVLKELYKREIVSVFVEGGAEVLGSFVDAKAVDKVYACFAPIIIGGREAISAIKGEGITKISQALRLKDISFTYFDDNFVVSGMCT